MFSRCLPQIVLAVSILSFVPPATAACGLQSDLPENERAFHRLHWQTKSEVQSAGFNIFRSEQRDGKYIKLNAVPLPSAKFSARVRSYEYFDRAIDPCKTYYYYIDGLSTNGESMRVSDTMSAGPKEVPAETASPDNS